MRERDPIPDNDDRYWADARAIGEAPIGRERSTARLRLHVSDEPHHLREALYPLTHRPGRRTSVHAHPNVIEPAIILSIRHLRRAPLRVVQHISAG